MYMILIDSDSAVTCKTCKIYYHLHNTEVFDALLGLQYSIVLRTLLFCNVNAIVTEDT